MMSVDRHLVDLIDELPGGNLNAVLIKNAVYRVIRVFFGDLLSFQGHSKRLLGFVMFEFFLGRQFMAAVGHLLT